MLKLLLIIYANKKKSKIFNEYDIFFPFYNQLLSFYERSVQLVPGNVTPHLP